MEVKVRGSLKRVKKLVSYALTGFLISVCVFAIAEYATGTQPFYVVDDNPSSMSPTLNYGDVAVICRTSFSSLGVGSIIAFHDPRGNPEVIVHRVVSVAECGGTECLVTKGDNNVTNPTIDPWNVSEYDYIGQAVLVVPYLGYISPALWGFGGLAALLPVSLVGITLILMHGMRRNPEKPKEEAI
jgi:signal peptidase I